MARLKARGRWIILTAKSDVQRWSHTGKQWSAVAQCLRRQTLNRDDPGLNCEQPCGTLSDYPVFPQFTQLYERVPGYRLWWVAVYVIYCSMFQKSRDSAS